MWWSFCPDARERAGPVFPPLGEEETQAQRARARRDNASGASRGIRSSSELRGGSDLARAARASDPQARLLIFVQPDLRI